jgi:putative DNA primase/helicase
MTGQDDLDELRGALLAKLEGLAETLLGAPSIRNPRTWRWGSKGSLSLELHGRKRGSWHDHESGQGGGPFHLVQRARSCSMADAIAWSRNWAGLPEHERSRTTAAPERSRKAANAGEAADQARRIEAAHSLWARSTSIAGTVAARYLTNARAIPAPSTGWPDAARFHALTCSLILAATTTAGAVQAVQRVHLTLDGRKAEGTAGRPVKVTNGVLAGAVVRLPGDPAGPLLLAEGPETGLSVWTATGRNVDHARQRGEGRAADRSKGGDRAR